MQITIKKQSNCCFVKCTVSYGKPVSTFAGQGKNEAEIHVLVKIRGQLSHDLSKKGQKSQYNMLFI